MDMYPVRFYTGEGDTAIENFRQHDIRYLVYLKEAFTQVPGAIISNTAKPIRINWFRREYFEEIRSGKTAVIYKIKYPDPVKAAFTDSGDYARSPAPVKN